MKYTSPLADQLTLRDRLCIQIERAWEESRDRDLPFRLAREYPALRDELLAFFKLLLQATVGPVVAPESHDRTSTLIQERLQNAGFGDLAEALERSRVACVEDATAAAVEPLPAMREDRSARVTAAEAFEDVLDYVESLEHTADDLADALDLPPATVLQVLKCGPDLPSKAKAYTAGRITEELGGDYEISMHLINKPWERPKAASRRTGYATGDSSTYRDIFEKAPSALSEKARRLWISFGDTGGEDEDSPLEDL